MFFPGINRFFIQKTKKQKREVTEHFPARYHSRSYREGIFQFISKKEV